jgi:DNA mismatch endonuclease (patch repair protein)
LADVHDVLTRSRNMAAVRGRNTKPELLIRKALHAAGYRYRLHAKGLPGKPDLVFPSRRAVIFVNGCFWHGHDCHLFHWPLTRQNFWQAKIGGNITRDRHVRDQLAAAGWRIADIWECALKGRGKLPLDEVISRCAAFLDGDARTLSIGSPDTVPVDGGPQAGSEA